MLRESDARDFAKAYSLEVAKLYECGPRERVRVLSDTVGESLTKQSMAESTDINLIVARHIRHDVPIYPDGRARYGDFSGCTDFHSIVNRVIEAQESFEKLPADVRKACANDPGVFLDMLNTEKGVRELEALGLVKIQVPANKPAAAAPAAPGGAPAGATGGDTVTAT